MILVVTNKQDVTSDLVILQLRQRGLPFARLNTEDYLQDFSFSWSASEEANGEIRMPGRPTVRLNEVKAAWYRRPMSPEPTGITDPAARAFALHEREGALTNLWTLLDCLWVSHPHMIRHAESKLLQLRRARSLGMRVPKSLVTSDPIEAARFCQEYDFVIAKPVVEGYVADGAGVIFTSRVTNADLERISDVLLAPVVFQVGVPRRFDLRVTVVGREVFATEIHLPEESDPAVDWRKYEAASLRHVPHLLPASLESAVIELVRSFGLQFSALDFIVTPDGQYVFLESNPNGQWAWIETLTGAPISTALTNLLAGDAEPL